MPGFLKDLFSSDGFMPHGHCYLWNPGLVWLHVISDGLVALAYTSIPFTLVYFARKRKDIPFNWMFLCFGMFIIACGATHLMEVWTLWTPTYWLSGVIKAITAAASLPTAVLLIRLLPRALAIPTPAQLRQAHDELGKAHAALETRVLERTAQLTQKNEELAKEIVERKRAEAALRESEARKTAVIEAALDAIVMMNHGGNITEFNPAAEKTFGYARSEVLGKRLADILVPPALRAAHTRGLARYLETGENHVVGKRIEVPGLRRDGSQFPAEVVVVRIASEGAPVFTGYIRDITERRQAAEADMLRTAKEAAEEANAELEAFSYSVAHDLRAPLRAISGFTSALQEDWADKFDVEAKENLALIISGAERMGQLIDALLALARLTRTQPRRGSVDMTELAQSTIQQLRVMDPSRTVDFVVTDGLVVQGDPQLLRVLLDNLIGNAWKFTKKKLQARIEFGREDVGGVTDYYVRDNGAGFDVAHVGKLFAPFRRLHSDDDYEGTGIGLATVQRIVRRHGGRVWAEGAENQGATFHFTLSAHEPPGGDRSWVPTK
jgi:two-component system, LuxR family, sensor kinase FixL